MSSELLLQVQSPAPPKLGGHGDPFHLDLDEPPGTYDELLQLLDPARPPQEDRPTRLPRVLRLMYSICTLYRPQLDDNLGDSWACVGAWLAPLSRVVSVDVTLCFPLAMVAGLFVAPLSDETARNRLFRLSAVVTSFLLALLFHLCRRLLAPEAELRPRCELAPPSAADLPGYSPCRAIGIKPVPLTMREILASPFAPRVMRRVHRFRSWLYLSMSVVGLGFVAALVTAVRDATNDESAGSLRRWRISLLVFAVLGGLNAFMSVPAILTISLSACELARSEVEYVEQRVAELNAVSKSLFSTSLRLVQVMEMQIERVSRTIEMSCVTSVLYCATVTLSFLLLALFSPHGSAWDANAATTMLSWLYFVVTFASAALALLVALPVHVQGRALSMRINRCLPPSPDEFHDLQALKLSIADRRWSVAVLGIRVDTPLAGQIVLAFLSGLAFIIGQYAFGE